jgi:signal peptidase
MLTETPNGVEKIQPVQENWIVGVAKFRIPLIGYLRLLIPV